MNDPQVPFWLAGGFLAFLCVVVAFALVILILYLLTLQRALSRVSPHNRTMEPGMVWLMLVPCVNIVWQFVVAIRVPESLQREFRDRNQDDGTDYGKSIAVSNAVLGLVVGVIGNGLAKVPDLALIANLVVLAASLVNLILFVVFWVRIAGYSSRLALDDRDDIERRLEKFGDDDDDDFGRRKPRGDSTGPSDAYKPDDPGRYK